MIIANNKTLFLLYEPLDKEEEEAAITIHQWFC